MRGPALALSWEIVARIRWLLRAGAVYFAVACVTVACLPASLRSPQVGAWLAGPLALVAAGIYAAALYCEGADVRGRRSGFPRRVLTLPVSSFTLATVPFVLGFVLLGLVWVAVALGLLNPCGADAPLVLPALAVTASLAWLQTFSWTPFPLPWLRMGLAVAGCYGLLFGPLVLADFGVDRDLISGVLAGALVLCYFTALVGVRLARRGVGIDERVLVDRIEAPATAGLPPPFSSSLRAQLWLEWRHHGWVSLWQTGILVLFMLPMIQMLVIAWERPYMLAAVGPYAERIGSAWMSLQVLLILPIAFSLIGGDVTRQSTPGRQGMSSFYATRAIDNPQMVRAKLLMTAGFVLLLWGQLLALALGWGTATGRLAEMMERLGDVAGFPGAGPAVLAVGVLVGCVVNWLWIAGSLWVGLSGRSWVMGVMMLAHMGIWVTIALVVKGWRPSWYPWLVGLVVAGLVWKAVAVAWSCRRLLARNYARPRTLAALVFGWVVVVGALASLAAWEFPGGWLTFAGVVLMMPLATSLVAPLSLAWDRHR